MFWKKKIDFLRTTTFRLTLWYLGIFGVLTLTVFGVVYVFLASHLYDQTDHEIMDTAREFSALYSQKGIKALQSEMTREAASDGTGHVFFELLSPKGKRLVSSDLRPWKGLETLRRRGAVPSRQPEIYQTLSLAGHPHRARVLSLSTANGNVLRIGQTLENDEILLERYRETFGTALAVMLFFGGLVGWLLARKAMSGVKKVTETASRIGRHDFSQRVNLTGEGEEIGALVRAFNEMLERIESLLKELRQITDNVAHELRTPITRIRGIAETTLKGAKEIEEYREMASLIIDGSDELIEMIGTMLEIAKTDSGVVVLELASLDIQKLIKEAVELFAPVAEDRQVKLLMKSSSGSVTVKGDRPRLQRVVANLLDNAIKYTPMGGTVCLSAERDGEGAKIKISDTGEGMDEKEIPRIFDRFYRCDKSRSEAGSGLGLSLALSIVRAHGGDIRVKSSEEGSVFTVSLP